MYSVFVGLKYKKLDEILDAIDMPRHLNYHLEIVFQSFDLSKAMEYYNNIKPKPDSDFWKTSTKMIAKTPLDKDEEEGFANGEIVKYHSFD